MPKAQTTSMAIAEMREFAGFTGEEQQFIARSLDVGLGRCDALKRWDATREDSAAIRQQYTAYRELAGLREAIPREHALDDIAGFIGSLVRISALDLAREKIDSFSAYRFLYERLLGPNARAFLPAAFCAAAALPQIRPCRRKMLLQTLSEAAATAPGWSDRAPCFFPERIEDEAA